VRNIVRWKRGESMKKKILIIIAVCVCVTSIILICLRFRPERIPNQYAGHIEQLHSSVDKDNDGIDDQVDILQGALSYVATKPKYQSKYYQTGYPNDGYGVCTDVVANALRSAGYDLMKLVQEDITSNPEDYHIDVPDANIDFRRVRNLKVYFAHTAIKLTTDTSEIEQWQGGDITCGRKFRLVRFHHRSDDTSAHARFHHYRRRMGQHG
jgi:uncharacterized protein